MAFSREVRLRGLGTGEPCGAGLAVGSADILARRWSM